MPGYYEQDPAEWWKAARQVLKKLTRRINPEAISALAISNQRETFVVLDNKGNSLRDAIIWLDERCKDEVKSFSEKIGQRKIHHLTGKPVDFAPIVYRLAWMKKHEPELYKKIAKVCDVQSYLVMRLTNSFSTSWASADPTGLFDVKNKKWSETILLSLELTQAQLPEVFKPGKVIGTISETAARQTGLLKTTKVIAGGGDGQAAGLGTNVFNSERAYLNLGTAVVAGIYGKEYRTSKAFRTMIACSEEGYIYESSLRSGTLALNWFIKNILNIKSSKQPGIFNQLQKEAEHVPSGSAGLLFLPYLNGVMNPYWDVNARGVFLGLTSSHNRAHMYRSILEGIAFEKLLSVRAIEKNIGNGIKEFVVIGGGTVNKFWCQIFADIFGKNICLPKVNEASGLGAAIIASVGAGWYQNSKKASKSMTGIKEIIQPNLENHTAYKRLYTAYGKIYIQTKSLNSILSEY